ncbi:Uncharacterized protein BM_BM1270 [Brugia malayi]|uniref:Bm1270 n=1 Tax=Brugia malayi TaxID=6279 RepID=A0A0J9XSF9_BRUMA|nr:Uncharacterized protein BM_BM1270 [Brugia malayi]CDP94709.1 Bm1270 [Brugia malayi]VIO86882.1 Uncharacterized protein BM_BM1270 [Brugia malayi]
MINSFLTISLLLGTYRLCGKTSLDRILSRPNSSCAQFVQNLFLKNRLPSNESNYYSRQNHNKTVVSYEYLENKTTEVSNNRTNNNASSEPEEMTASSEIFESYSCITIDLKDSSCFLWRNSGHKLPCQAVSGMTFPVSIVAIDLIYLICTIISVTRSILPLSRKIDFVRCAIHIILWCTASTSTMYLLNTWEHAWKYTNFKAKIPKQFYIAMIFSVTNVIVYCVEIFYSKWLYMRIRLFIKPEMEQLYERLRAGEEMDTGSAVALATSSEESETLKNISCFQLVNTFTSCISIPSDRSFSSHPFLFLILISPLPFTVLLDFTSSKHFNFHRFPLTNFLLVSLFRYSCIICLFISSLGSDHSKLLMALDGFYFSNEEQ